MKKSRYEFDAHLVLNENPGGAWMAYYTVRDVEGEGMLATQMSAWKSAAAAKRWIKSQVVVHTPRKSIKLEPTTKNGDKPTSFTGVLTYLK